jgi:hypothetical protein
VGDDGHRLVGEPADAEAADLQQTCEIGRWSGQQPAMRDFQHCAVVGNEAGESELRSA